VRMLPLAGNRVYFRNVCCHRFQTDPLPRLESGTRQVPTLERLTFLSAPMHSGRQPHARRPRHDGEPPASASATASSVAEDVALLGGTALDQGFRPDRAQRAAPWRSSDAPQRTIDHLGAEGDCGGSIFAPQFEAIFRKNLRFYDACGRMPKGYESEGYLFAPT
jgi:hypothetical protein